MVSRTHRHLAAALAALAFLVGIPQGAAAQTGSITGVVVDASTGLTCLVRGLSPARPSSAPG